jgi:hypothetical protein
LQSREQIKGIQNANVQNKRVALSSATRGVCVCDIVALPFTLKKKKKSILRQKKTYGNSNIFYHAKDIIFKTIL